MFTPIIAHPETLEAIIAMVPPGDIFNRASVRAYTLLHKLDRLLATPFNGQYVIMPNPLRVQAIPYAGLIGLGAHNPKVKK
jgi:hypothetical protein